MLVCEGGTTVPRRRSTTVQGVLQRREALNQSRPCSDGERSAGSTIQGQVCRQLGTTPVGEGSELITTTAVAITTAAATIITSAVAITTAASTNTSSSVVAITTAAATTM